MGYSRDAICALSFCYFYGQVLHILTEFMCKNILAEKNLQNILTKALIHKCIQYLENSGFQDIFSVVDVAQVDQDGATSLFS